MRKVVWGCLGLYTPEGSCVHTIAMGPPGDGMSKRGREGKEVVVFGW